LISKGDVEGGLFGDEMNADRVKAGTTSADGCPWSTGQRSQEEADEATRNGMKKTFSDDCVCAEDQVRPHCSAPIIRAEEYARKCQPRKNHELWMWRLRKERSGLKNLIRMSLDKNP
jgi:hypothetical protein